MMGRFAGAETSEAHGVVIILRNFEMHIDKIKKRLTKRREA
jgi:hypothetical protein